MKMADSAEKEAACIFAGIEVCVESSDEEEEDEEEFCPELEPTIDLEEEKTIEEENEEFLLNDDHSSFQAQLAPPRLSLEEEQLEEEDSDGPPPLENAWKQRPTSNKRFEPPDLTFETNQDANDSIIQANKAFKAIYDEVKEKTDKKWVSVVEKEDHISSGEEGDDESEEKSEYSCHICERQFAHKYTLKRHLRNKHRNKNTPYRSKLVKEKVLEVQNKINNAVTEKQIAEAAGSWGKLEKSCLDSPDRTALNESLMAKADGIQKDMEKRDARNKNNTHLTAIPSVSVKKDKRNAILKSAPELPSIFKDSSLNTYSGSAISEEINIKGRSIKFFRLKSNVPSSSNETKIKLEPGIGGSKKIVGKMADKIEAVKIKIEPSSTDSARMPVLAKEVNRRKQAQPQKVVDQPEVHETKEEKPLSVPPTPPRTSRRDGLRPESKLKTRTKDPGSISDDDDEIPEPKRRKSSKKSLDMPRLEEHIEIKRENFVPLSIKEKRSEYQDVRCYQIPMQYFCGLCDIQLISEGAVIKHIERLHSAELNSVALDGVPITDLIRKTRSKTIPIKRPVVQLLPSSSTVHQYEDKPEAGLFDPIKPSRLNPVQIDKPPPLRKESATSKRFACKICNVNFQTESNVIKHLDRLHPDQLRQNSDLGLPVTDLFVVQTKVLNIKYRTTPLFAHSDSNPPPLISEIAKEIEEKYEEGSNDGVIDSSNIEHQYFPPASGKAKEFTEQKFCAGISDEPAESEESIKQKAMLPKLCRKIRYRHEKEPGKFTNIITYQCDLCKHECHHIPGMIKHLRNRHKITELKFVM